MKQIVFDSELKKKLPNFQMAVVHFEATPEENAALNSAIKELEERIEQQYQLSDVLTIPNIFDARQAYKDLGKDPSRYRLAVESLYRRLVKGNKLYRINNLVDIGNVLSLKTIRSTAVLDGSQIKGETILIRIGGDEPYEGIGRGHINVENIPVYCDEIGPFGSTTSDTERTMVTDATNELYVFIISFSGYTNLLEDIELAKSLFSQYSNAKNFSTQII